MNNKPNMQTSDDLEMTVGETCALLESLAAQIERMAREYDVPISCDPSAFVELSRNASIRLKEAWEVDFHKGVDQLRKLEAELLAARSALASNPAPVKVLFGKLNMSNPVALKEHLAKIEQASQAGLDTFRQIGELVDSSGKDDAFSVIQTLFPTITRDNLEWMLRVARGECEADAIAIVRFMAEHQAAAKNS